MKREIDERLLKKLLDSHAREREREQQEQETKAKNLKRIKKVLNGWGPLAMVAGGAALLAAPSLIGLGWSMAEIVGGVLAAAGKVTMGAGAFGSARAMYNAWSEEEEERLQLPSSHDEIIYELVEEELEDNADV